MMNVDSQRIKEIRDNTKAMAEAFSSIANTLADALEVFIEIRTETQNSNLTFEKADERCKGCNHYKITCDLFSEICRFEPKDEPQTCDTCRFDDRYGDESICKECARSYSDNYAPIEDEPHNCPYYPCAVWDEMAFTRERSE